MNATGNAIWSSAQEISIRPTTSLVAEATRQRFAYYASVNGNRSNYGLQTPIPQVYNDAENGYGGFASFIYNRDSNNQFRVVGSLRQDYYQIPVDPNPNSVGNQILEQSGSVPSYGLHDAEREPDAYVIFSWVHTFDPTTLLTLSPFYHYNAAHYEGSPDDYPVSTNVNLNANYVGFQGIVNKSSAEERSRSRRLRLLPAPVQLFRQPLHRRHAEFSALFHQRKRRRGRGVHQRPLQRH